MLSKIMKRAHELAQQMEGHYAARLSLALREAWKEAKEVKETKLPALTGSEKQIKWAEEIRSEVVEVLDRCWGIVQEKGKEREFQRAYDRLVNEISDYELAAEVIDRFREIGYKTEEISKIGVLKKGFLTGRRFFLFVQNQF